MTMRLVGLHNSDQKISAVILGNLGNRRQPLGALR